VRGLPRCGNDRVEDLGQPRVGLRACMKLDETLCARRIEEKTQRLVGGGFGWRECVKCRTRADLELLSTARILRRTRWDRIKELLRQRQRQLGCEINLTGDRFRRLPDLYANISGKR
jgi:hypothetical protein